MVAKLMKLKLWQKGVIVLILNVVIELLLPEHAVLGEVFGLLGTLGLLVGIITLRNDRRKQKGATRATLIILSGFIVFLMGISMSPNVIEEAPYTQQDEN